MEFSGSRHSSILRRNPNEALHVGMNRIPGFPAFANQVVVVAVVEAVAPAPAAGAVCYVLVACTCCSELPCGLRSYLGGHSDTRQSGRVSDRKGTLNRQSARTHRQPG